MPALAAIPAPPFDGLQLGPLDLRMYGLVIAIGAYLALRMTIRRYGAVGGDPVIAERAALFALLGGFLGARLGYVIPRLFGEGGFLERPLDILAIWQGGLAFFGGLVGGALAVTLYLRHKGVALSPMADAIAPALPLAQAIGRWGNYFNQELFGRPTDLPWALQVDPGPARRAGFPDETTFHPTFLYESLWNLGLVWLILVLDRRGVLRRRGSLFFVYLIGYGAGRGWVEALRVDTVERYLGLSRNNWIAILVVVIGVVGLIWWEQRGTAPLRDEPIDDEGDDEDEDPSDEDSDTSDDGDAETSDDVEDRPADAVQAAGAGTPDPSGPEQTTIADADDIGPDVNTEPNDAAIVTAGDTDADDRDELSTAATSVDTNAVDAEDEWTVSDTDPIGDDER